MWHLKTKSFAPFWKGEEGFLRWIRSTFDVQRTACGSQKKKAEIGFSKHTANTYLAWTLGDGKTGKMAGKENLQTKGGADETAV